MLDGGIASLADTKLWNPRPNCFRLFEQVDRRDASRAACTAGRSRLIRKLSLPAPPTALTVASDRDSVGRSPPLELEKELLHARLSLPATSRHSPFP